MTMCSVPTFVRFLILFIAVVAAEELRSQTTSQDDFQAAVVMYFEKNSAATVGATVGFLRDRYGHADIMATEQRIGGAKYYRIMVDSNRILEVYSNPMALCNDNRHREALDSCVIVDVTVVYRQLEPQGSRSFSMYCPLLPRFESMKDSVSVSLVGLSQMLDKEQNRACRLQDYLNLLDKLEWRVKRVGYNEPDLYINGVLVTYQNGISVAFTTKNISEVKRRKNADVISDNKDLFVQHVSFIMPNEIGYPVDFFTYRSTCAENGR